MSGEIVPFGKYKGQAVEVMAADRDYCDWLLAQPWAKDKLRSVYNIIINYGAEPQDTPEHNALQAKFLDDAVCMRLWRNACPGHARRAMAARAVLPIKAAEAVRRKWGEIVDKMREDVKGWEWRAAERRRLLEQLTSDPQKAESTQMPYGHYGYTGTALSIATRALEDSESCLNRASRLLSHWLSEPELAAGRRGSCSVDEPTLSDREFENGGWDVTFRVRWRAAAMHYYSFGEWSGDARRQHEHFVADSGDAHLAVECKPSIGDDFPSVLRQVKNHKGDFTHRIVVVGSYTGQGATLNQVKEDRKSVV